MFDLNEIVNDIRGIHKQELEKRRSKMMTENEIRNQLAVAQTKKDNKDWDDELDQWALFGYIHGLSYVLGELKAKFNKEDI